MGRRKNKKKTSRRAWNNDRNGPSGATSVVPTSSPQRRAQPATTTRVIPVAMVHEHPDLNEAADDEKCHQCDCCCLLLGVNPTEIPDDLKPMVEKAAHHRHVTCPYKRIAVKSGNTSTSPSPGTSQRKKKRKRKKKSKKTYHYREHNVWRFKDRQFAQFGLGLMLYFRLVRKLIWVFLSLSVVVGIPMLVLNMGGSQADDAVGIETTTLGNIASALNATVVSIHGRDVSKRSLRLAYGYIDLVGIVVFLFILLLMTQEHERSVASYKEAQLTVARFSVQVWGIPSDPDLSRDELARFFSQYGQVVDATIAHNDGYIVLKYAERGKLNRELTVARAREDRDMVTRIRKHIAKLDEELQWLEVEHARQSVCAFITFQQQESVRRVLREYPNSALRRLCMAEHKCFKGHHITVLPAPEPSNILFHHLSFSPCHRAVRRAITFVATVLVICFSVVIVFIALFYQRQIPQNEDCPADVTRQQAGLSDELRKCFCKQLGTDLFDETEVECSDWLRAFIIAKVLSAVAALTIIMVNVLLRGVIARLVSWEKHSSQSTQQNAITVKLFVALFLNTAVVLLVVNATWAGGEYEGFVPDWYDTVGVSIIFTMVLNMVNPLHILALMQVGYDRCKRRYKTLFVTSQTELNDLFSGRDFEMAERFAHLLNTVFVILFYSTGMPVLLLVGAGTFTISYWVDKYTFLRVYRIPPRWDQTLPSTAIQLLPLAALLHTALAIWVLTAAPLGEKSGSSNTALGIGDFAFFDVPDRITQSHVIPLLLLLCLLIVHQVLGHLWLLVPSLACLHGAHTHDADTESPFYTITFDEACEKVRILSYRMSDHLLYQDAFLRTKSMQQLNAEPPLRKRVKSFVERGHRRRRSVLKPHKRANSISQSGPSTPQQLAESLANQPLLVPPGLPGAADVEMEPLSHSDTGTAPPTSSGAVEQKSNAPVSYNTPNNRNNFYGNSDRRDSLPSAPMYVSHDTHDSSDVATHTQSAADPSPLYSRRQLSHAATFYRDSLRPSDGLVGGSPGGGRQRGATSQQSSSQRSSPQPQRDNAWSPMPSPTPSPRTAPVGLALIDAYCPNPVCGQWLQLQDYGQEMMYTCPFCGQSFVI